MNQHESGPSALFYGLGALVILAGLVIFVVFLMQSLTSLTGLTDSLTQVVAPGTKEIEFSEPGRYSVFYEHNSVIGGRVYRTGENIHGMQCTLISRETGEEVTLSPPSGKTSYHMGSRQGYSLLRFTIDTPGTYEFSAQYSEGAGPQVVLALGRAFPIKAIMALMSGIGILVGTFLIGALIIVVTLIKRHRARKQPGAPYG